MKKEIQYETYDFYDGHTHIIVHRPILTDEERQREWDRIAADFQRILQREIIAGPPPPAGNLWADRPKTPQD